MALVCKMKKQRKGKWLVTVFTITTLVGILCGVCENTLAQDVNQTIVLEAQKGRGRRDPRLVKRTKTRRGISESVCTVEITNNTTRLAFVYSNGTFRGTVRDGKTLSISTGAGRSEIYVRTDRTLINFLYWGPSLLTCSPQQKDQPIKLEINPASVP